MQNKGLKMNECKPNCFEKTEAGRAFFIFHQITDELSTKHEPRLRTTSVYVQQNNIMPEIC
jgi:hypothetical protein